MICYEPFQNILNKGMLTSHPKSPFLILNFLEISKKPKKFPTPNSFHYKTQSNVKTKHFSKTRAVFPSIDVSPIPKNKRNEKFRIHGGSNSPKMIFSTAKKFFSNKEKIKVEQTSMRLLKEDPGDWKHSLEWWGRQGNGWGYDDGETVFCQMSSFGNGQVTVTSHLSSPQAAAKNEENFEFTDEDNSLRLLPRGINWRVLRFNEITRQSVARVKKFQIVKENVEKEKGKENNYIYYQQPDCLSFEYLKSMVSVSLSSASLAGVDFKNLNNSQTDDQILKNKKLKILCIGLGGGSLPLFLAHHLKNAVIEVVEIDPTVINASVECMGFPFWAVENIFYKNGHPNAKSLQNWTSEHSKFPSIHKEAENILWKNFCGRITVFEDDAADFVEKKLKLVQKTGAICKSSAVNGQSGINDHAYMVTSDNFVPNDGKRTESDDHMDALGKEMVIVKSASHHCKSNLDTMEEDRGEGEGEEDPNFYDIVFIDAFDGNDNIPTTFSQKDGKFIQSLTQILHPKHGTVVMNLHGNLPPPSIFEKLTANFGPGYDKKTIYGKTILETCLAFRDVILGECNEIEQKNVASEDPASCKGFAFTIATKKQDNVLLVVSRTSELRRKMLLQKDECCGNFAFSNENKKSKKLFINSVKREAKEMENALNVSFSMADRAIMGLYFLD